MLLELLNLDHYNYVKAFEGVEVSYEKFILRFHYQVLTILALFVSLRDS